MTFINKDFRIKEKQKRHPGLRWLVFIAGCAVLSVVIAQTSNPTPPPVDTLTSFADISQNDSHLTLASSNHDNQQSFSLSLPALEDPQENTAKLDLEPTGKWREFKVKSGDSLAVLFKRAGIQPKQLDEIMKSGDATKQLTKIFPGDIIRVLTRDENDTNKGELLALQYEIDHASYLQVERNNEGKLESRIEKHALEKRSTHATGTINSSLFLAAEKAGISQNIIMELAGIFGWDIDFVLDIRKGDSFTVVYEEIFRDGEKIANGDILSAEFINNGKTFQAVRYTTPETDNSEYYTADGKSMRKAFLRSPVNFTRISSGFSIKRYHPILHKFRSHKGVDYAAKRGTPILSAGDGKVTFKGKKGGYGRVIIVQHGTSYSTLYAHMNSYNKKLKVGSRVKQGQTVGYVGSSGLATGPHLHYEFRVAGVHRNPLTVKLPAAQPVPKRFRKDFERVTAPRLAQLELLTRTQVALNDIDQ